MLAIPSQQGLQAVLDLHFEVQHGQPSAHHLARQQKLQPAALLMHGDEQAMEAQQQAFIAMEGFAAWWCALHGSARCTCFHLNQVAIAEQAGRQNRGEP